MRPKCGAVGLTRGERVPDATPVIELTPQHPCSGLPQNPEFSVVTMCSSSSLPKCLVPKLILNAWEPGSSEVRT